MRRLFLLAALALSAWAGAERYAILVAVDSYPIIKPPQRQLSGSAYDLRLMGKMMEFYNFQVTQLARGDATRGKIIEQMSLLQPKIKAGDEVVFYFSGRGSVAPPVDAPKAKVNFEPTIVPYDGKETVVDYDIRMSRLEDWAKSIAEHGGNVTFIIDASFQSIARDDVGRPYNPTPRTLTRKSTSDGAVRDKPYMGPGIYLGAVPTGGSAYEYLVNTSNNTWAGAFTDMLVNEVISKLRNGESPTYSSAMREIEAYFKDKVRQDYMPGLAPYPFTKTLVEEAQTYDRPLFGGLNPQTVPPPQQAEIQHMDEDRKARERKLRIGLSFPAVRDRASTRGDGLEDGRDPKLVEDFTKSVSANLPYAEVVPVGAPVDTVVAFVKQANGSFEARIFGDEVDQKRNLRFPGANVEQMMAAGLRDQLERQALTVKLFKLIDEGKGTLDGVDLSVEKDTYAPSDRFALHFKTGAPSLLYVFDRDDADGITQLTFPTMGATENLLPAGGRDFTPMIAEGSPTGKMMVKGLFVEPSPDLPSIEGTDEKTFNENLLKHLRALVPLIEGNKLKWFAKEISLTIKP